MANKTVSCATNQGDIMVAQLLWLGNIVLLKPGRYLTFSNFILTGPSVPNLINKPKCKLCGITWCLFKSAPIVSGLYGAETILWPYFFFAQVVVLPQPVDNRPTAVWAWQTTDSYRDWALVLNFNIPACRQAGGFQSAAVVGGQIPIAIGI